MCCFAVSDAILTQTSCTGRTSEFSEKSKGASQPLAANKAASQQMPLLDIASVTASRSLAIAAITASRLLAVGPSLQRPTGSPPLSPLPVLTVACRERERERERERPHLAKRDLTWRNSSSLIFCFGLLGRAYLSNGTGHEALETKLHRRRLKAGTTSTGSQPPLASPLAVHCFLPLDCLCYR